METLTIILDANCFGTEECMYWPYGFLFFGLIILLCFLFRGRRRRTYSCWWPGWTDSRFNESTEAKDILKKRYAKGEISKEEYEKMKKEITW